MKIPENFLKKLKKILSPENIITQPELCEPYSHDDSKYTGLADIVVFPENTQQVSQIIKLACDYNIPVIARGGGTGTPGGAVPVYGGLVLSLIKLNKIIEFCPEDRFIKTQTGITTQKIQDIAAEKNFFWAPDPGSAINCTVGGNIACNAAGPRAIKYGSTRENILGLTAVTGTGEIIHTGGYTTKSAVGYDLTRLLIGSEGTLGIITEAVLKLTPQPEKILTLLITYKDINSATQAITQITSQPYIPSALEFLDKSSAGLMGIDAEAVLLINIEDEKSEEIIKLAANNSGLINMTTAKTETELKKLWSARKLISPGLKTLSPHKINEDIVIPVSKIPEFLKFTQNISQKYNLMIINFGHAGNGNLHVNILAPRDKTSQQALEEIFKKVINLGGTISGEHGIGIDKAEYMKLAIDPVSLNIMREIKKIFDPKGILNPGKIFPRL